MTSIRDQERLTARALSELTGYDEAVIRPLLAAMISNALEIKKQEQKLRKRDPPISHRFEELVTTRQIREETGLPAPTVRSLLVRAYAAGIRPVESQGMRISVWRRNEVAPYFGGSEQNQPTKKERNT